MIKYRQISRYVALQARMTSDLQRKLTSPYRQPYINHFHPDVKPRTSRWQLITEPSGADFAFR